MQNKKKKPCLEGYLTVEASFLIPLTLFIYIFLVFTAFFLYNKCLLAQDYYLLCFRGSTFTGWGEGYGEVIYGYLPAGNEEELKNNIKQRSSQLNKEGKYPAFQKKEEQIEADSTSVTMTIKGKTQIPLWKEKEIKVEAKAATINPIAIIRTVRRESGK